MPTCRTAPVGRCAVLAIAGDAGGARALAPVVQALRATPRVSVEARAYGAAVEIWRTQGLAPTQLTSDDPAGFDRVLAGTSFLRERWELRVVQRARAIGVPSLMLIDFWSQYRQRFTLTDGQLVLPDQIAVVDEAMRGELVLNDFPPDCLIVTGQPAFESLQALRLPARRRAARGAMGDVFEAPRRPRSRVRVLFVSQPLSLQYSQDELGYHEEQVLSETVGALGAVLEAASRHGSLLVKLHPRDVVGEVERSIPRQHSPRLTIRVLGGSDFGLQLDPGEPVDVRELALASDLVVGMNSTALMEACLIGRPVVSYQPGLRIRDPLPSNRLGWSRAVYRPVDLAAALAEELFSARKRSARLARLRRIELPHGAAATIASLVVNNRVQVG